MKATLKRIVGSKLIARFRKWFPSRVQKNAEIREIARKVAFYGSFVPDGSLCFDVGANVGNRIEPLLSLGARVVAVEPQKKCYHYLERKFGNRIIVVKKGLGESEGEKAFHLSQDSTLSSFSDTWMNAVTNSSRFKDKKWVKTVRIAMTTIDELIVKYGKPSFIKIDVEGYELEVLKGLTRPVGMISFEYTVPEQPERAIQCITEIQKYDLDVECNYSIGEDLVWALPIWIPVEEMKRLIVSEDFQSSSFGDIYVRSKNSGH